MTERITYILNLLCVFAMLAIVAIGRDGRVVGYDVKEVGGTQENQPEVPAETVSEDGMLLVNTISLGKDITGFGGPTPVEMLIKDGVIVKVEVLPNSESPTYMDDVLRSGMMKSWDGMSLEDAATAEVDAVSGSTFTADAIIENVRLAAVHAAGVKQASAASSSLPSTKELAGLAVVLLGVLLSLKKKKSKTLMLVQMALNVGVVGLWCGSFLSLAIFTSWVANGVNFSVGIVAIAMLLATLLLPLFGRKGSYCQMMCPMGAAQGLLAQIPFTKIKISQKATKFLNNLRYYILAALLGVMWMGLGFDLMNYEVFSIFIFGAASNVILVMGGVFLVLSMFIHKPYCRFVCPTGALITVSQLTKS